MKKCHGKVKACHMVQGKVQGKAESLTMNSIVWIHRPPLMTPYMLASKWLRL